MNNENTFDIAIIGVGIVGLATAYKLLEKYPDKTIVLIEKEQACALHQTGRNSGVIHAGPYYKPGSLKADLCVKGNQQIYDFCKEYKVPHRNTGKLIVALNDNEVPRLDAIEQKAVANGVPCELYDQKQIKEREPYCSAIKALFVKSTGVVNYGEVSRKLADVIVQRGAKILYNHRIMSAYKGADTTTLVCQGDKIHAKYVIACAGLHSDTLSEALLNKKMAVRIVPFRGEYYSVSDEYSYLCNAPIYPVPDPERPFLGVHIHPNVEGHLHVGPNAVLAFGKEAYTKTGFNVKDLVRMLSFPGFWKVIGSNLDAAYSEMKRSLYKKAFHKEIQKIIPDLPIHALSPDKAGNRAQAISVDGTLVDDFVIEKNDHCLCVINAPSPAATASLAIADYIVEQISA